MTDIELLARRVEALEEAQLDARISSLEVAADRNAQADRVDGEHTWQKYPATQDQHTEELKELRGDMKELRADMNRSRPISGGFA